MARLHRRPALVSLLALLSAPLGAEVIEVDPSSPDGIQAAIDAASPGDVLLVPPSTYHPFVLDRRLALIGVGSIEVLYVESGSRLTSLDGGTLANLRLNDLRVTDVAGSVELIDCRFEPNPDSELPLSYPHEKQALAVERCGAVLLQRCSVESTVSAKSLNTKAALFAEDSSLAATGCLFRGADAVLGPLSAGYEDGSHAVFVRGGEATFEACRMEGGRSGATLLASGEWIEGLAGDGMSITGGATVRVRNGGHLIAGNTGLGLTSFAVRASLESTVLVADAELSILGAYFAPLPVISQKTGAVVELSTGAPWAEIELSVGSAAEQLLAIHAPASAPVLVALGAPAPPLAVAGIGGHVWLDPTAVLAVLGLVGQGLDQPLEVAFSSDLTAEHPSFGTPLVLQAFYPTVLDPVAKGKASLTAPLLVLFQ